jgi:hypothetical protein
MEEKDLYIFIARNSSLREVLMVVMVDVAVMLLCAVMNIFGRYTT